MSRVSFGKWDAPIFVRLTLLQGDQIFHPLDSCLLWVVFLKMTEVAQVYGLLFPNVSATYVHIKGGVA
jgi:hypothetical protein